MKSNKIKFYLSATIILAASIISCQNQKSANQKIDLKGIKPPEVKKPTADLQSPPPVKEEETMPLNSKQDTTRFSYQILVDNKKSPNRISMRGNVTELANGRINIKTEQLQSMQINYFLPGNQQLLLSRGDTINTISNEEFKGASINHFLNIESRRGTVISSAVQTENSPIKINIDKNTILQQETYNEKSIISDSKYDTHYIAPLSLIINGQKRTIEQKKEMIFESNDQKYKLTVFLSSFSIPKKDYESVAEGQGYFLDYLLLMIK